MPNKNYQRGRRLEWQRRAYWQSVGMLVIRSAGSKSPFDLVLIDSGYTVVLLQCKRVKTMADANRLCRQFRKNPPLEIGFYNQLLEVLVPKHGVVSTWVGRKGD